MECRLFYFKRMSGDNIRRPETLKLKKYLSLLSENCGELPIKSNENRAVRLLPMQNLYVADRTINRSICNVIPSTPAINSHLALSCSQLNAAKAKSRRLVKALAVWSLLFVVSM